jgi:hypothetical protein
MATWGVVRLPPVNDRTSRETDLVVRWAFAAGKRHGVALGVQLVTDPEVLP